MEIIIVRHGLTQTNKDGIVNGQLDEPLAEEGETQAQSLAKRLENRGIEVIFSSPLKRTTLTALPIAEKINKEINVDHRLIEVHFGSFEGKPNEEMIKTLGHNARDFLNKYKYDFTPYGGESSEQVETRVRSFINDLKKMSYKRVLIVTHGGILRWIHYVVNGQKIGSRPNGEELDLKI
jgi:broad specificity phosphatase PhoE